jgi:DNA repair exonuclease SbcCD nuclease subunit
MSKKVALITDIHWGVHKSSPIFLKSQIAFFKNQFVPYLIENGIDTIFMLGDLFDNRQAMNVYVYNEVFKLFDEHLRPFKIHVICGNHDIFYKTTVSVNSLKFLNLFENVTVYEDVELLTIEEKKILLVPWQVDNLDFRTRVANKNIHCDVCMGHLEVVGFKMSNPRSDACSIGLPAQVLFENYALTFSGHFHHRSKKTFGNSVIQYIGNPFHLTRHDINEDRGFCILNLEDLSYEFVTNTESLRYVAINYPNAFTEKDIKGNVVDVHVVYDEKYDEDAVQKYLNDIEKLQPAFAPNLKIENNLKTEGEIEFKQQSILELFKEYVQSISAIDNKDKIYALLVEVYNNCKSAN